MKLFSPLGGVNVTACRTLGISLENGEIIVNRGPQNTIRILGSDCLMERFSLLGGACLLISIRYANKK
jgi:hypothetical protein